MRQRRRYIHDLFAGSHQLLGQQPSEPIGVLDRPHPWRPGSSRSS